MTNGIFVTGTGTEVGKTLITAGILSCLISRDIDAIPVKPIQTGGVTKDGFLVAPDLEFCLTVADLHPSPDDKALMAPYIYEPACSPHLAGRMAKYYPDISEMKASIDELSLRHDVVIVEGAGGIMVPLDESTTMLDFMKELGFPVILVAHAGLGTINHTLLSVHALREASLEILGIVFNEVSRADKEDDFIIRDNPETVARFSATPILGHIEYMPGLDAPGPDFWQRFERQMPGLPSILERVEHP